jgi:hypothetical protein
MTHSSLRRAAALFGTTVLLSCLLAPMASAQGVGSGFLFDATKAEMAGNADWVIDADLHNLNVTNGNGSGTLGTGGTESNPQRVPTPAASGVTANTPETYWTGGLSAWGVSLVKNGQSVETLPYNGAITYGNATNPQDLSHYKVFAMVEPNILFTASEKTALLTFVQNGGGLFIVADHTGSDRNNDGSDSLTVLNDLFTNNSVKSNPFGITFNKDDITPTTDTADSAATDPLTHGAAGTVMGFQYSDGASITINPANNASVAGAVWTTATHGNTNVMVAYATYGLGRVVAVGDSSPFDDGTGDPNDTLFDGWDSASDSRLITNASLWLAAAPEPNAPAGLLIGGIMIGTTALRAHRSVSRPS